MGVDSYFGLSSEIIHREITSNSSHHCRFHPRDSSFVWSISIVPNKNQQPNGQYAFQTVKRLI